MEHMAHRYDENLKELIKNIDEMERRIERAERDLNCCQNTERSMGG
jgi:exoribonuclease R